jgi:hypothetical protein
MEEIYCWQRVRLSSHEITTRNEPISTKELCLDLQGVNPQDEIVWLHFGVILQLTPGTGEPWTEHGKAVYAAWPGLYDMVREYLEANQLTVGGGIYGISKDILPLYGNLENTTWDNEAGEFKWITP